MHGIFKAAKILIVPAYLGEAPKLERLNWGETVFRMSSVSNWVSAASLGGRGGAVERTLKKKEKRAYSKITGLRFFA